MQQIEREAASRICLLRNGKPEPRFSSAPILSSAASSWHDLKLERHHVRLSEDSAGVIEGCLICCNIGTPTQVQWQVNSQEYSQWVGHNDVSIGSTGSFRSAITASEMDLLLLWLSSSTLRDFGEEHNHGRSIEIPERRGFRDTRTAALLRLLYADVREGCPAGALYGEQLGTALASYLCRRFAARTANGTQHFNSLPGMTLKRVCDFIESRLDKPVSLTEMATESGFSRFYFARLFRNSTGLSPAAYVVQRRLERAKQLLESSTHGLHEIAHLTGFSSHSHFTAQFRRHTGVTPSRFRYIRR